ncbi:MAG: hypothetical protein ABFS18_12690 [Thermodesulfobacteriota bacterium]
MSSKQVISSHWSFWAITIFMLIWNIMGCINFFVQMNPDMVASYRENEQAIISGRPVWATIAFAIAVFGGALGCILLMLKKYAAFYLFVFSLLGVVITTVHTLSIGINFGVGEIIGIILMPPLVAAFLVWYTKYVANKGWITT